MLLHNPRGLSAQTQHVVVVWLKTPIYCDFSLALSFSMCYICPRISDKIRGHFVKSVKSVVMFPEIREIRG